SDELERIVTLKARVRVLKWRYDLAAPRAKSVLAEARGERRNCFFGKSALDGAIARQIRRQPRHIVTVGRVHVPVAAIAFGGREDLIAGDARRPVLAAAMIDDERALFADFLPQLLAVSRVHARGEDGQAPVNRLRVTVVVE